MARELVENLEKLRAALNANLAPGAKEHAVVLNSGARCFSHNQAEGGKKGSQHLYDPKSGQECRAADLWCPTRSVGEVYQAALAIEGFKGVGLAPPVKADPRKGVPGRRGYVHVDVRDTVARVQWGYDEAGRTTTLASVLHGLASEREEREGRV